MPFLCCVAKGNEDDADYDLAQAAKPKEDAAAADE